MKLLPIVASAIIIFIGSGSAIPIPSPKDLESGSRSARLNGNHRPAGHGKAPNPSRSSTKESENSGKDPKKSTKESGSETPELNDSTLSQNWEKLGVYGELRRQLNSLRVANELEGSETLPEGRYQQLIKEISKSVFGKDPVTGVSTAQRAKELGLEVHTDLQKLEHLHEG
jgi:hypothetical protein